ncbi:hypothetical protein [Carnobacterium sp. TMP28]|uniref:hypothetical protein n=1 Tax=Carnobacterium sp. TMP28 TaxID=3397060 RepID=UPI0039DF6705
MEEYEALQAKLRALSKKEISAKIRYQKNSERFTLAETNLKKESRDVEKLQSESLATFIKQMMGHYDKKLDKELQEKLAAKVELDLSSTLLVEAQKDLAAIQLASEETSSQISQLKDSLYSKDPHFRDKIADEEINRAQLKQELIELDEASAAGDKVLAGISEALDDLESADSYSTWDMFTNSSFLLDMLKYDKINTAEAKMNQMEKLLENYDKELKDLSLDTSLNYETFGGMSKTFDIFFDNFFSDWDTKEKIKRNSRMLKTLGSSVLDLQDKLEANKQELHQQIEDSELFF